MQLDTTDSRSSPCRALLPVNGEKDAVVAGFANRDGLSDLGFLAPATRVARRSRDGEGAAAVGVCSFKGSGLGFLHVSCRQSALALRCLPSASPSHVSGASHGSRPSFGHPLRGARNPSPAIPSPASPARRRAWRSARAWCGVRAPRCTAARWTGRTAHCRCAPRRE
jgi:hypothetical protein